MNDGDEIELRHPLDRGLDGLNRDRQAGWRNDLMHTGAAPPKPGAEIAAIGAGDDVDRRHSRAGKAQSRRLQRQDRLGLDENHIGRGRQQSLQPIGQRRVAVGWKRGWVE
jgi:hypothetical protein